jgi:hypothetical protein
MNPQTQEKTAPRYEPRDPHFYLLAFCTLSAALVPATASPVYHAADHTQAEDTARSAARILDGGPAPEGFVQRAILRRMAEVREYQATTGMLIDPRQAPTGMPVRLVNAAEVQRAREREALREKEQGPMPTVDELKAKNLEDLSRFRDLSEPVRDAALRASAVRLAATNEITGARPEEAIGIVCEEIMRAIRFAEEIGIGSAGLSEKAGLEDLATGVPYPASLAMLALVGAMSRDGDDETEPQTAKPREGA